MKISREKLFAVIVASIAFVLVGYFVYSWVAGQFKRRTLCFAEQRTGGVFPHGRQLFVRHTLLERPSSVVRHSVMAAVYARHHVTDQPLGGERHFAIGVHHGGA